MHPVYIGDLLHRRTNTMQPWIEVLRKRVYEYRLILHQLKSSFAQYKGVTVFELPYIPTNIV